MRAKKFMLAIVVVLMGVSGLLSACSGAQATPAAPAAAKGATPTVLPAVKSDNAVMAEAKIVPIQNIDLSFSASGVVKQINYKEGDSVKSGDVIATLDGKERMEAAVTAAQLGLLTAQKNLKELNDNADVARANAQLKLAQAEKALDTATKNRNSRDYTWGDKNQIDLAWANYVALQQSVKDAEDAFTAFADRPADDANRAYMLSLVANARERRDKALENYNYLVKKPDKLDVSEADGKLTVAQANVKSAEDDWNKVKDGPNPDDLAIAQAAVQNAEAQLAAAKAGVDDLVLKAPYDGVIVSSSLKVGQMASPATLITVADTSSYQVETTDLTELNVVSIKVGSTAKITIDALPDLNLTGKVIRIKSLGEDRLGDVTYKVTIQLDKQDPRLRWNMTASAAFEK
jgi:HlyD family secretion protein